MNSLLILDMVKDKIKYTKGDLDNHISVSAIITDVSGKLLIMHHNKFSMWTIPVGKVDPGQTVDEALHIEMREEIGIEVLKYHEITRGDIKFIREGKPVYVTMIIFVIDKYRGTIINNEPHKHTNLGFVSIRDIENKKPRSHVLDLYLSTIKK